MKLDLDGKVALVTGASRGIGAAIARALVDEGVRVGIHYVRSAEAAESLAATLHQSGPGDAVALSAELSEPGVIPPLFDQLEQHFGPVDILVNNAAHCPGGPLESYDRAGWEYTFSVNVTAAFEAAQECIRRLRARQAVGKIVNVASQAAFLGSTSGHLPYDASKGALVSMTRSLAREVAREQIHVNAVAPGMVRTEMVAAVWEERKDKYLARIPLHRIAEPEEVAQVVVFLASRAAAYMTGTTLDVTGGMLMR